MLALIAAGIPRTGAYSPSLAVRPVRATAACLSAHMSHGAPPSGGTDRRSAMHEAGRGALAMLLGASGIENADATGSPAEAAPDKGSACISLR